LSQITNSNSGTCVYGVINNKNFLARDINTTVYRNDGLYCMEKKMMVYTHHPTQWYGIQSISTSDANIPPDNKMYYRDIQLLCNQFRRNRAYGIDRNNKIWFVVLSNDLS